MDLAENHVRCFRCKKDWSALELANPRRCPVCGCPTQSGVQLQASDDLVKKSLDGLRVRSSWIMRLTSLCMAGLALMYCFPNWKAADPIVHLIVIFSVTGAVLTELWARTANRWWMLAASLAIQAAALLFFCGATAVLTALLRSRIGVILAALPLAGALSAWYDFRGYSQILGKSRGSKP